MILESVKELILSLDSNAKFKDGKDNRLWVTLESDKLKIVLKSLKDKGYNYISTISGLDQIQNGKIVLLYHIMNDSPREYPYITIRIELPREDPKVSSIHDILPGALLHENEVFDMFGVNFVGHPNLGRLLLPENVRDDIHPLRRDFKDNVYEGIRK
ncbi:MAG: NADH-quinone oxidoreductase subunit C [Nitrososphaeria archaeon]